MERMLGAGLKIDGTSLLPAGLGLASHGELYSVRADPVHTLR